MYLQNDAEMVGKTLVELYLTLIENGFKSMNDLRKKMNIINKIIMVDNNILSSISGQIFNAGKEK